MTDTTLATESNSSLDLDESNGQNRQCWICFDTEHDDEIFINACRCSGSMTFAHETCLQRWIDEKQKRTNSPRVSCSQCKTQYILSYPPANKLVRLIERYDKLLYGSSPFLAVSVVVGSFYWCCGSYGFVSIIQVMGYDEGKRIIEEADPLLLVIGLPVIPITLVLAKLIKWEDFILRLWRSSAFKLPRPLSYIIEEPPARPRANCDQVLFDPGFNEPLGCTRMICGALLLPTISAIFGKIFFSKISGSQWRRSLIGGVTFLLIKGLMKIYLRKSQYVRYSQRRINNYVPSPKSIQNNDRSLNTSNGGGGSIGNADLSGSDDIDGRLPGLSGDNDDTVVDNRLQEDSDDDSQPRALFSMTIRI